LTKAYFLIAYLFFLETFQKLNLVESNQSVNVKVFIYIFKCVSESSCLLDINVSNWCGYINIWFAKQATWCIYHGQHLLYPSANATRQKVW